MEGQKKDRSTIRLASVFSGIGAIEHAFKRLNIPHSIVFASDIDKYVKQSYFANYDIDEQRWIDDIRDINARQYRNKVDILVGGSPCQSFSMIGQRRGLEDERGSLIYHFIDLIRGINPKVFIFENVKGLLNHNSGKTWDSLHKEFLRLNYQIHYKVLNSRDYGIPQNRERLFVVGFRDKSTDFEFPQKQELTLTMQDMLEDAPAMKYALPVKGRAFVTKEFNLKKRYTQIDGEIALCQRANQQFNWHGDFISFNRPIPEKYFLSNKLKAYVLSSGTKNFYSNPKTDLAVARPILSTLYKMHRAGVDNYVTSRAGIRRLTPRECLRLMGFGDNFKIVVSDTQAYKQAGNSIVVDILIGILKQVYDEQRLHSPRRAELSVAR